VKESSFLNRETSIDDVDGKGEEEGGQAVSPPVQKQGVPIRWQH
jgi:hypothetical protein